MWIWTSIQNIYKDIISNSRSNISSHDYLGRRELFSVIIMKFDYKTKIKEWKRVLHITKKPSKDEFLASSKITGIGMLIVGLVGFLIYTFARFTGIF